MNTPKLNPGDPRTELEQRADLEAELARVALLGRQRRAPTDDEIIDLALATEHGGEAGGDEPRLHYFRDSDIVEFALRLLRLNGTAQAQPDHSAGVSKMVGAGDHMEQPLNMVEPVSGADGLPGLELSDDEIDAIAASMPDGAGGMLKQWGYRQFAQAVADHCAQRLNIVQPSGNAGELDERAAFEAHFSQPPFEWEFHRYGEDSAWPGNCQNYDHQCAWEAWEARAALSAQSSGQGHPDQFRDAKEMIGGDAGELPPLPESAGHVYTMEALVPGSQSQGHVMLNTGLPAGSILYTEEQMQDYARAALAKSGGAA